MFCVGCCSYAGFSSTDARIFNSNKTTSAITPGPGTYSSSNKSSKVGPLKSTTFRSKVCVHAQTDGEVVVLRLRQTQRQNDKKTMRLSVVVRAVTAYF